MNRNIIITDLTRFKDRKNVCIAGVDIETAVCIRPMPYMSFAECEKLNILPGAKLNGMFSPSSNRTGPHQEDHHYKELKFLGPCSSEEFKGALEANIYQ